MNSFEDKESRSASIQGNCMEDTSFPAAIDAVVDFEINDEKLVINPGTLQPPMLLLLPLFAQVDPERTLMAVER